MWEETTMSSHIRIDTQDTWMWCVYVFSNQKSLLDYIKMKGNTNEISKIWNYLK